MICSIEEIAACVRRALCLDEEASLTVQPLFMRASLRTFYRLTLNGKESFIFLTYDPSRSEHRFYVPLALFLKAIDLPVPEIIYHDEEACYIIMEDLREKDLWSLRNLPWEERKGYYRNVIQILHRLHNYPIDQLIRRPVPMMEPFGEHTYRWEQEYFLKNFVENTCGLKINAVITSSLLGEFSLLGAKLSAFPSCLIHRDFQSKNVMFRGNSPILIDFQGMRLGNPYYDLASLLYDPYVSFLPAEREELFAYYEQLQEERKKEKRRYIFLLAAAQRLLQALGAYGFLKGEFLVYVPNALKNLLEVTEEIPLLNLHGFAQKLYESFNFSHDDRNPSRHAGRFK